MNSYENKTPPKVSVILPVYNVEPYLRECLDSVVNQTFANIEIICVNDGSTDGGPVILEEFQRKDPRITVIHQENMGLSAARNRGICHAVGTFICFLDCDDFLNPETLNRTVPLMEDHHLDVLVFEREIFYELEELREAFPQTVQRAEKRSAVFSGVEYLKAAKDNGIYNTAAWGKIWRRSFLTDHDLFFKEGIIHEDNLFCFLAFMAAKRVLHIPDVLYHRRIRPNSIITRPISHKNVLGLFACAESMLAYALHGTHSREEEREIMRAYTAMINTAKRYYLTIPPEEKAKVVFQSATVTELFKQTVLSSIQIDELKDKLQRISPLKSFQVNDVAVAQDGNTLMLTNYFSAVPVRYAWYVYKGRVAIKKQMYTRENSNSFSYEFTESGNYSITAFVQMMDKSDTKSVCAATVSVKESGLIWRRP